MKSTRQHEHGVAQQSRAHQHSAAAVAAAAAAAAPSGTRAIIDSSSTCTPAVLLLLFYFRVVLEHHKLEQHELEEHCVLMLHLQQEARKTKLFAAKNTKIQVGFQAPGWLFGSGAPSPEFLAGSRDFDHVEHVPRSPAGSKACTARSSPPLFGPCSKKHGKLPAAIWYK